MSTDLDSSDSPQSCLSKGVKDPESPKKRVSFDIYGKENLRQKAKMADYQTNVTYKYDTYSGQLGKGQCLRLLSAKDGLLDLQQIGLDKRYNKRNLLYFRWDNEHMHTLPHTKDWFLVQGEVWLSKNHKGFFAGKAHSLNDNPHIPMVIGMWSKVCDWSIYFSYLKTIIGYKLFFMV